MPSPISTPAETSGLNTLIAPEVFEDEFYRAIVNLGRSAPIRTVLEIGSSSGGGSTQAWVEGLRQNPLKPELYCMEVSRVRHAALKARWDGEGFVHCFLGSSVRVDQFPPPGEVAEFHRKVKGPLQAYPLEEVLGWLKQDIDYIQQENVPSGGIAEIKRSAGITHFGAVLIDGSEFTGNAELDEVYGAEFILLDDTQTFKCHQAHQRLLHDPGYELIAENPSLRHGYAIFRRRRRTRLDPLPEAAPINFFTIVLNGEPFIRHHLEVMRQLAFPWHWHIVEGAAELKHDTAWSSANGGTLPSDQHCSGLSTDGTTAYLDDLASRYPGQVSLYRPPANRNWDGKIEMVAEPLRHIFEEGLLWQIDADELWTAAQFEQGRRMFLESPEKAAAWFWCHYFVGSQIVISSRNCYAQNPGHEWLRVWRFRPGMKWLTHEPPALAERMVDGSWRNLSDGPAFSHRETEAAGLVFQHFAYVTEAQLRFKQRYYGYEGALEAWQALQLRQDFPLLLKDFFPWVKDDTIVNTAPAQGIQPLAQQNPEDGNWQFNSGSVPRPPPPPTIVLDGIFFQLSNTGIGRVWLEILKCWAGTDIASRLCLLDRDGSAPRVPGIRYRTIPPMDPERLGEDSLMLQSLCDELHAGLFISTYYSGPTRTPSVSLIYDMIPELLGLPPDRDWQWARKNMDLLHSGHFACISQSTAHDLQRLHPEIPAGRISVITPAAPPDYQPPTLAALESFRDRYNLPGDYVMVAGERIGIHVNSQGYKNAALAFRAWSLLPESERRSLTILCAGGKPELEEELRILAPGATVRLHRFSDEDMATALGGAVALIYPSLYEGFGLPVIEAMACGCPVITCRRASLTEVAGDAACFVDPWDAAGTAAAIRLLRQDPEARARYVALGKTQAGRYSYPKAADSLARLLIQWADHRPMASTQGAVWDMIATLQSGKEHSGRTQRELRQRITHEKDSLKAAQSKIKSLREKVSTLQARLDRKKRKPLKRMWDFIRGKTHS